MISLSLVLALTPAPQGLKFRAPEPLGNEPAPAVPKEPLTSAFAVAPDRMAFTWLQANSREVLATWSDGRAVDWSTPLALPLAPQEMNVLSHRLLLAGNKLLVLWNDNRILPGSGLSTTPGALFVRSLDLKTQQLGPELSLKPSGVAGLSVSWVKGAESVSVGAAQHVHLLLGTWNLGNSSLRWRLLSSHDGGQTFPFDLTLLESTLASIESGKTRADLAVEGSNVHAVIETAHFRSVDGGQSLDGSALAVLPIPSPVALTSLELKRAGGEVLVAWARSWSPQIGQYFDRIEMLRSLDGGTSFGNPMTVASLDSQFTTVQVQDVCIVPESNTRIVAWATGNVDFDTGVMTSATQNGLGAWSFNDHGAGSGARWIGLYGDPSDRSRVLSLTATFDAFFFPFFCGSFVRLSRDGGMSWTPLQQAAPQGEFVGHGGFESKYQNAVWVIQDNLQWKAGGARAQTLNPTGFVGGSTQIGAGFDGFDDGSPQAWMVAALGTGSLPLPDGRQLDLAADALFFDTLSLALNGVFSAPLNSQGDGQLSPLAVNLPPGVQFTLVGVAINPATFALGDISDPVTVTVQ